MARKTSRKPALSGPFWSIEPERLFAELGTTASGLSADAAAERLDEFGPNLLRPRKRVNAFLLLLGQFRNPLVLILVAAAALSFYLKDHTNSIIILVIVVASGLLGFWQEYGAAGSVEKLLAVVRIRTMVRRGGADAEVPVEEVVPGDLVVLNAGDVIPADCRLLESRDLFCDEAALTGESLPAEKTPGRLPADTALAGRTNSLFMGTHVVSGTALAVVAATGLTTEFGHVSERLRQQPAETEFARGVRRFGFFLLQVTLGLVTAIFAANVLLKHPVYDSFLFSLALAVGLTPQLLPAIMSVSLSRGARHMAARQVIVKRLSSIESFGSMNVLCSDKTGTLTQGQVRVRGALDAKGSDSGKAMLFAFINAGMQTGFANPIDAAVKAQPGLDLAGTRKLDEVPYDFVRKRLSILVQREGRNLLITKGALRTVLAACSRAETAGGSPSPLDEVRAEIEQRAAGFSGQGLRVLGVAYKDVTPAETITRDDERDMTFLGLLVLEDPLKPGIAGTVAELRERGVRLKLVSGDNRLVAETVGRQVGLENPEVITGTELHAVSDEALPVLVDDVDVFAEVEPSQKERIVRALRHAGHVVGFLGDGINDAPALHAADVGISVDSAVDVAKEAADIVLLRRDLSVLVQGVGAGRRTFANTLKYVFMATSANFGNMFSMAGGLLVPAVPAAAADPDSSDQPPDRPAGDDDCRGPR